MLAVVLLGLDAAATVAFPSLARLAVDGGIQAGSLDMLWLAVGLGLVVVAVDWVVVAAQTVLTARIGEGRLFLLRTRSFAHLQRLGLDFYERELGGRIMTRMTTDVDALSSFLQTGWRRPWSACSRSSASPWRCWSPTSSWRWSRSP